MVVTKRSSKAEPRADFDDLHGDSDPKISKNAPDHSGPYHESVYTPDVENGWPVLEIFKWISFAILTVCAIIVVYNYYMLPTPPHSRTTKADGTLRKSGMSPEERKKTEEQIKKLSSRLWKNPKESPPPPKPQKPIVQEINILKLPPLQRPIPPSDADRPHVIEILSGEKLLRLGWHKEALEKFDELLKAFPQSPRGQLGAAEAKCSLAEELHSTTLLDECMELYTKVGESFLAPDHLRVEAISRLLKPAALSGKTDKKIWAAEKLFELQPNSIEVANQLSFYYLSSGKVDKGKAHLKKVLEKWPKNVIARAHMGRILIFEGDVDEGSKAILEGIEKEEIIRKDPTFYQLLGDALVKKNRKSESDALYKKAAEYGVFPSQWQRPIIMERDLKPQPFWSTGELSSYSAALERIHNHLESIRSEALQILEDDASLYKAENPAMVMTGNWRTFILYAKGKKESRNCALAPKTCALLATIPDATKCTHGQIKFALLSPSTVMWPHTSKANTKLRMVFTLQDSDRAAVVVAQEQRQLSSLAPTVFDNSFEHQLKNEGEKLWVGLVIDVWHPDLTDKRRSTLRPF